MKYQTKQDVIAAAQAVGSTATTWHGARRWMLAHIKPLPLDAIRYSARKAPPLDTRLEIALGRYAGDQYPALHRIPVEMWTPQSRYRRSAWIARIEARADRVARDLGIWPLDAAEALAASLTQPYLTHAAFELETAWPYRKSESKWAGGEHDVSVCLGQPSARCESNRAWSHNGKWSGTNSAATISTDLPTLLDFPTLMTRDGLALCRAEKIGPREYKVTWIEQSTGVSLKTVSGWLIRGYHVRAPGIESARKKAAAARTAAVAATLRARQAKIAKRDQLASLRSVWLSVEDSVHAGNCKATTELFASRIWSQIGASAPCAVRADVVLSTRDDYYTRRALGVALARNQAVRAA